MNVDPGYRLKIFDICTFYPNLKSTKSESQAEVSTKSFLWKMKLFTLTTLEEDAEVDLPNTVQNTKEWNWNQKGSPIEHTNWSKIVNLMAHPRLRWQPMSELTGRQMKRHKPIYGPLIAILLHEFTRHLFSDRRTGLQICQRLFFKTFHQFSGDFIFCFGY